MPLFTVAGKGDRACWALSRNEATSNKSPKGTEDRVSCMLPIKLSSITDEPVIEMLFANTRVLPVPEVLPISRPTLTWGSQRITGRSAPALLKEIERSPAVKVAVLPCH